ncbi:MAG: adenylyl-sulfate kinase, partial [Myxococcota bacterium]|nr:adenylyl-sulfate kinase [Myxococcota bacterium]
YRYFSPPKRKFIAADTPGHEQYTRNMVTGASTAELAIILVDATKGLLTQTRRHSFIASLLGLRHIILAINKMDLVDYDEQVFQNINVAYEIFAKELGFDSVQYIPTSALKGDNVVNTNKNMPWYKGDTLLKTLEDINIDAYAQTQAMRFPVQWVNRPSPTFRGYSGSLISGQLAVNESLMSSTLSQPLTITNILGPNGALQEAHAGQAITLCFAEDIDISRGDVLFKKTQAPKKADQFAAHLVWMDTRPTLPERTYILRLGCQEMKAQITDLRYRKDINSLENLASKKLELNEIGYCNFALERELIFDAYSDNRNTGSFILIDPYSHATVGAGMIDFALRRASNLTWQHVHVDKKSRSLQKEQKPCVLWFTGLSGSGKSSIADALEQELHQMGCHTYLLDGDNVRHGLNKDLGFTDQDRVENIRRVSEVAKLMADAGLIVLVSFISPFRAERDMARNLIGNDEFVEIFVDAPLEVCEQRDPKGLYNKARAGKLKNFTGIDSAYESPLAPDLKLQSAEQSIDALVEEVLSHLKSLDF